MTLSPDEIHARRLQAGDWLEYACDYVRGRTVIDPVAALISEGRGSTPSYSSCGDLPNWMLFRVGVRLPWLNRKEHHGWRVGQNLNALFWPPAPSQEGHSIVHTKLECGDMLEIWNRPNGTDAHAICVIDCDPDARVLLTAEGGQKWGAEHPPKHADFALCRHTYTLREGLIWVGGRAAHRWLPFAAVLTAAEEQGLLADAEVPPQLHQDGSVS